MLAGGRRRLQGLPRSVVLLALGVALMAMTAGAESARHVWNKAEFARRPTYAYPIPHGRDNIIGTLLTYRIEKGDTLLDVGRWFGLTATEISDANDHLDWWTPPPGKVIVLPTEHILPNAPRSGLVLNIPELRIYYYPPHVMPRHRRARGHLSHVVYHSRTPGGSAHPAPAAASAIVYTFPVGLGRYDWRTPIATFRVTGKVHNPTWVVPEDIYEEHLERDGEAEHVVPGGDPDNPLGHYKLALSLPLYAIHGTNNPWGVGMEVSHGCVRLYPEDIKRLYAMVKPGTPGRFVYQPVKFGWREGQPYVEVHPDTYSRYPRIWVYAMGQARKMGIADKIDVKKLQDALQAKTGVPTYIGIGPNPSGSGPG
jgi:L,D-transpeptidase ErfK/SrfK